MIKKEDNILFEKIKKLMGYYDSDFDLSKYKTLESFDFYNIFDKYNDNLLTCIIENHPINGVELTANDLLYIAKKTNIEAQQYIDIGVLSPVYLMINAISKNELPYDDDLIEHFLKNSGDYSHFGHKFECSGDSTIIQIFKLEKNIITDKQILKDILLSTDLNSQDDDGLSLAYYSMQLGHVYGFDTTKFLINNTNKEINDIYFEDHSRFLEQYTSILEESELTKDIKSNKIKTAKVRI